MKIIYTGKASDVAANVKALADDFTGLTLENYLLSLARERRAIAAIAGATKSTTSQGGAAFNR